MKRLLILCAGLTSLLALATVQANTPPESSTAGVNHISFGQEQHSSFTVKDYGPDSVDRGNFNYQNFTTGVSYNVDVACVKVTANRADFAFVIPAGAPDAGMAKVVLAVDNGEPSAGPPPDLLGITQTSTIGFACSLVNSQSLATFTEVITAGNIQVHS
jgi:hypothetical protein